jgi:hypothetical protein
MNGIIVGPEIVFGDLAFKTGVTAGGSVPSERHLELIENHTNFRIVREGFGDWGRTVSQHIYLVIPQRGGCPAALRRGVSRLSANTPESVSIGDYAPGDFDNSSKPLARPSSSECSVSLHRLGTHNGQKRHSFSVQITSPVTSPCSKSLKASAASLRLIAHWENGIGSPSAPLSSISSNWAIHCIACFHATLQRNVRGEVGFSLRAGDLPEIRDWPRKPSDWRFADGPRETGHQLTGEGLVA